MRGIPSSSSSKSAPIKLMLLVKFKSTTTTTAMSFRQCDGSDLICNCSTFTHHPKTTTITVRGRPCSGIVQGGRHFTTSILSFIIIFNLTDGVYRDQRKAPARSPLVWQHDNRSRSCCCFCCLIKGGWVESILKPRPRQRLERVSPSPFLTYPTVLRPPDRLTRWLLGLMMIPSTVESSGWWMIIVTGLLFYHRHHLWRS